MNILFINHYAGSPEMGMEFRPYYMAREWVKAGHDVTIVAGDYSHLRQSNPSVQRDFQEQVIDGIRYVWVKTGEYEGNGSARAFTMFRFVRKLCLHALGIVRDYHPDVVIASSTYPLDTYAAQRIAKLAGAKLVHEVHDMWPATLYEIGGMSRSHPFVVLMQVAEDSAYKHSDKVVSLLGEAEDYMIEHGLAPGHFVHIPNGVVEEEWVDCPPIPEEHRAVLDNLHAEGKFVVGYFGGHAISNALDGLLDVARCMLPNENVAFVLVGSGVEKPRLQARKEAEGLRDVHFLPPIPKACVPDLLAHFDCSYIQAESTALSRFGMSLNKMYDSMMGALPIVFAFNMMRSPVSQFACGFTVSPDGVEEPIAAIELLQEMSADERAEIGQRGRRAVLDHFTYKKLAEQFLQAVEF